MAPSAARRLGWALAVLSAACQAPRPPRRRPHVEPPDVPVVDGGTRRCVLRSDAPGEVSRGADPGRMRVAWNGEHWAVVWSEVIDDEPAVFFARVDADGHRPRPPLRVSERRTHASAPAVVWNRTAWSVFFTGGLREVGDLYQARVASRGSAVGRPWRMTRGERLDLDPAVATSGTETGLVWAARGPDQRWSIYGEVLDRWDRPRSPLTLIRNSSLALGAVELGWTGQEWAAAYVTAGREVFGVELARLDPAGLMHGSVRRMTDTRLGDVTAEQRFAIAWNGQRHGLAWSELRDGQRQLFFRWISPRGNPLTEPQRVGLEGDVAAAPALVSVGDGTLVLAWESERDGDRRVAVALLDEEGVPQREPVTLRGVEGVATRPALAVSADAVGVVTRSERGISFHRVTLGACRR
ncbi:MAG: hypothetical protein Q8S73_05970 [Deltaproteobacteria bacterium]|nr:hypothetical protein [Myxococcales bacterium]MDP3213630.1 hypothetical protein [Deltaproteobacteria bacterium]